MFGLIRAASIGTSRRIEAWRKCWATEFQRNSSGTRTGSFETKPWQGHGAECVQDCRRQARLDGVDTGGNDHQQKSLVCTMWVPQRSLNSCERMVVFHKLQQQNMDVLVSKPLDVQRGNIHTWVYMVVNCSARF